MTWQLADAKNHFSEVVRRTLTEGPQKISRRKDKFFMISEADYLKMQNTSTDFRQFLLGQTAEEGETTS